MMIFGAVISLVSLSACTNQEDVGINYQASIVISAQHLFAGYQPMISPTEFDLDGNENLLQLTALIYAEDGALISKDTKECNSMSQALEIPNNLEPGKYTLVSIASFKSADFGNAWEIKDEQNINYLSIESTIKFSGVFATLGVDYTPFEIHDRSVSLDIDIKPVTALIGVFYWNNALGTTTSGYASLASFVEETIIKANDHNNKVSFTDGNLDFSSFSNGILYELSRNYPLNDMQNGKSPTTMGYIAMLPTKGMSFFPTLRFTKQAQSLGMEEYESGQDTKAIDIEVGKQYVLDFVLAAPKLFFSTYDKNVLHEDRLNKLIDDYNEEIKAQNLKLLEQTVDYNFHTLIGESKAVVENALNLELSQREDEVDVYKAADDMLGTYVVVKYWDASKSKVKQIIVMCDGCFSGGGLSMDSFHQFLEKKYIYQEWASNPQVRYYFSSQEFKSTKYVVVLDNTRSMLVYDAPELH